MLPIYKNMNILKSRDPNEPVPPLDFKESQINTVVHLAPLNSGCPRARSITLWPERGGDQQPGWTRHETGAVNKFISSRADVVHASHCTTLIYLTRT